MDRIDMDVTNEVKNVKRHSLAGRKRKIMKKGVHAKEEKQLKEEGSIHNSKKIRKDQEENNKHHIVSSSTPQVIPGTGLESQESSSEAQQQRKENSLLSCCSLYLIPSSTSTNVDSPSDPTSPDSDHFTTTASDSKDDAEDKETSGSIFSIRPSNPVLDLLRSDGSATSMGQTTTLSSTKPINLSKLFTISSSTEFPLSLDDAIVYHGRSGGSITVELAGGQEEEIALEAGQEKSCFSFLSEELVVEIFSFLRAKSVVVCCLVCRQWHRIGMTNCLWVRLTRAHFPMDCDDEEEEEEEDADSERGNPKLLLQCQAKCGPNQSVARLMQYASYDGAGRIYRMNAREKFIVKYQREREREKRMFTLQEPEAYIYHMSLDELWDRTSGLPERIDIAITAAEKATEYNQCGNFLEAFEVSKTAIYFLERLIRECKPGEGRAMEESNQRRYLSWHLVLADVYTFKGLALRKMDYHSLAIVNYNKSICISEQVQENYPEAEEAKLSREFMATACKNCGVALSLLGRPQEALMYCDKGIELLKAVLHESWTGGGSLAHMRIDTLLTFITNRFKVLADLGLWERAAKDIRDVFRTLCDLQRMNHSLCADPYQSVGQSLQTGQEFNALLNLRGDLDPWSSATADEEDIDPSNCIDDLKFCGDVWQGICYQVHDMGKRAKQEFCTALGECSPRVLRLLVRSLARRFGDKSVETGNGNGNGEKKVEASW